MTQRPICAVVGAGPGNGLALARRFTAGGYRVALLARRPDALAEYETQVEGSVGVVCDVADPEAVRDAFATIGEHLGPVEALLYNAGSGKWGTFESISAAELVRAFEVNAVGLLECVRAVVPGMRERGRGVIGVTGATASLRGKPKTVAFAAAKGGQRLLAQALARQLGPEGIHVYYAILDAIVDLPRTRAAMPDRADEDFMKPDDFAEVMWTIAQQPRSAWSFEIDVRPFKESW